MDYITVAALRQEVKTELSDETLQAMIRRASAAVTRTLGAEPAESVTERFVNQKVAWLTFEPDTISSVVESGTTLSADQYLVEGRAVYKDGSAWSDVVITYTIADRDIILALCEQVCVELVKCMLAQSGYASERIGDWSGDVDPAAWNRALAKLRRWRPVMA
ncbi:MAG: hypothetical protein ACPLPR_02275 [Bacillota bacterium]